MIFNNDKLGKITIEVSALMPEKILNILWKNNIYTCNIVKINLTTIKLTLYIKDFTDAEILIKKYDGKIRIIKSKGIIIILKMIKRKYSLVIGSFLFFLIIYILSNYIWAIEINTQKNLSPFEIRQQLSSIGIKPGVNKSNINVYELEKKMEDLNSQIMWIRIRIEGSTLNLNIKEKINPPTIEKPTSNQVVAKMDGEIKRVYTSSGNSAVVPGDIVKAGQELILPIQGREGFEKEVKPNGTVIANTFYEKFMEIQIKGEVLERTGEKASDIYINVLGKKFYIKKSIDRFNCYDKIEEGGFFNKTVYFEKKAKYIDLDKDSEINNAAINLYESLKKTLSNDAKVIEKKIIVEEISDEKILVKVIFTVEQDIAMNIP